jgi:hypothetical protein
LSLNFEEGFFEFFGLVLWASWLFFCLVVVVGFLCIVVFVWLFFGLWGCFGFVFGVCWL